MQVAGPTPAESALMLDSGSRDVWVGNRKIEPPLSRKEFDVLSLLYIRADETCSRDEIAAWGWPEREGTGVADGEIDQCIRRLRLRIETEPSRPRHIVTMRRYGYKLCRR